MISNGNGIGGPARWFVEPLDQAINKSVMNYLLSQGDGDESCELISYVCADGKARSLLEVKTQVIDFLKTGGNRNYHVFSLLPKEDKPKHVCVFCCKMNMSKSVVRLKGKIFRTSEDLRQVLKS